MKRFILIVIACILAISLISCGNNDEIDVGEGLKLAGNQAGNKAVEYSFTYPEEWELCRNDGVVELQFDCDESAMTAKFATVAILSFDLADATQSVKGYWEGYEKDLQGIYADYELLDTEENNEEGKMLDDSPALKQKYVGTINGVEYFNEQVICCRYGSVYLITLSVPNEFSDKVNGAIDTVIEDFKFA